MGSSDSLDLRLMLGNFWDSTMAPIDTVLAAFIKCRTDDTLLEPPAGLLDVCFLYTPPLAL